MRFLPLLSACGMALTITQCATTGDPTQGGLFGWSESKAQQRQSSLQSSLAYEQSRASSAQQQATRSKKQRNALASKVAQQHKELDALGRDIAALRAKILADENANAHLLTSIAELERAYGEAKKSDHSYAARASLIRKLRGEVNHLRNTSNR